MQQLVEELVYHCHLIPGSWDHDNKTYPVGVQSTAMKKEKWTKRHSNEHHVEVIYNERKTYQIKST